MLAATRSAQQDLVGTQDNNALASQYEGLALGERGLNKIRKEIGEVDEDRNQARARREREAALVSPLENEALRRFHVEEFERESCALSRPARGRARLVCGAAVLRQHPSTVRHIAGQQFLPGSAEARVPPLGLFAVVDRLRQSPSALKAKKAGRKEVAGEQVHTTSDKATAHEARRGHVRSERAPPALIPSPLPRTRPCPSFAPPPGFKALSCLSGQFFEFWRLHEPLKVLAQLHLREKYVPYLHDAFVFRSFCIFFL